jgi:hypothetical protein
MGAAERTSPGVRVEPANLENLAMQLEKGEAHGDWLIVARDRKSRSNKEKDYTLSYNKYDALEGPTMKVEGPIK